MGGKSHTGVMTTLAGMMAASMSSKHKIVLCSAMSFSVVKATTMDHRLSIRTILHVYVVTVFSLKLYYL